MASALKIDAFEIIHLRGPEFPSAVRRAWAPGTTWRRRDATLVKLTTDDGLVGWGTPGYEATPALESWIKPRLLGADPFSLEQHARVFRNVGGCWGVEIALWDIVGKAAGQPLYKLWGGYAEAVPAYASFVELRTPEQRAEDALRVRAAGYRAVKLRLHDWTMKEDLAQVEAGRRKVAALAELHRKLVAPHHGGAGIGLAAHLHLCAAIPNASYLELWHDPPCMTSELFQWYLREPLTIDAQGNVVVPAGPGLGIE